jgi:hypothetical protein
MNSMKQGVFWGGMLYALLYFQYGFQNGSILFSRGMYWLCSFFFVLGVIKAIKLRSWESSISNIAIITFLILFPVVSVYFKFVELKWFINYWALAVFSGLLVWGISGASKRLKS